MIFRYKTFYVSQVDESDCGVACLAMILKYYKSKVSLASLRILARTNLEGTTAWGLIKAAHEFNLETEAIKTDMTLFNVDSNVPYPFIVHVVKENKLPHYYVVVKSTKTSLVIADPDSNVGLKKVLKTEFVNEWTGVALLMKPAINYQPTRERFSTLWSLFFNIFKHKGIVCCTIIATALMTTVGITSSYFLQGLIDTYIPKGNSRLLSVLALGLIIAYFFNSLFSYGQSFLLNMLGKKLSIEINLKYIQHVFELPIEFFLTRRTGEITSRFSDAEKIIEALASMVISIFVDFSVVLIMGGVLLFQNSNLFMIVLFNLPIYIFVIGIFIKKFERLDNQQMESNAKFSSSVIEDIQGIETIKSLNGEQDRYNQISYQFIDYLEKSFKYNNYETLQRSLKIFIQLTLNMIILWIGSIEIINHKMSIGQLMTFDALLSYFLNPLQNIVNLQPTLELAQVAQRRLSEIHAVQSEFKNKGLITGDRKSLEGCIEYRNVSYHYGYGATILKNINLKINPNEKLVIVGMSGSGKSTLVKLLVDFFSPNEGKILFNNLVSTKIDKHLLRSYVNYVPQTPYIFSGTIKENLLFGSKSNITEEDIIRACRLAAIDVEIKRLPLGLETRVDENAKILSTGQKQRLTIARSLLSPAKVIIFDEATSSLDTITEKQIIDNLLTLQNKTIIFIAHRLSIAKRVNNIVVLDHGKIIEKGSYNELMQKHSFYFKLVKSS